VSRRARIAGTDITASPTQLVERMRTLRKGSGYRRDALQNGVDSPIL
jgi:hypothetical protein